MLSTQSLHMVLLPGLLNDARVWQHQTSGLSSIANIWVGDLTKATSINAMAKAVIARAPADQFVLAGLSMGGYVALEIMRQVPERIIALALLDTSARPDNRQTRENRRQAIKLAETDYPAVIAALLPKLIHPAQLDNEMLVSSISLMAMSLGKDTFIRQQNAIAARIDSRPFLARIQCPTLVMCGREDAITPLALHQEMVTEIANSGLVIIDNCGHLSALEQPSRVNEALKHWLSLIHADPTTETRYRPM